MPQGVWVQVPRSALYLQIGEKMQQINRCFQNRTDFGGSRRFTDKYIVGYEMIRCDGHGMKKEMRKCGSCRNFQPIEGSAKGKCSTRGDVVQRSRIICTNYIARD